MIDKLVQRRSVSSLEWVFMTPCRPEIEGNRALLRLPEHTIQLKTGFDAALSFEKIKLNDPQLLKSWSDVVYRLIITPEKIEDCEYLFNIEPV